MTKITYHILALPSSHESVLRSMVLLAEKQSGSAWAAGAASQADVLFIGPEAGNYQSVVRAGQILISVGEGRIKHFYHLDMPLIFPRVAKLLLTVSEAIAADQEARAYMGSASLAPSIWDVDFPPVGQPSAPPASGKRYHIKNWPPPGASSAAIAPICARRRCSRANT